MNWTVQCAEYYLYRGVSRTNAYEFMQQSGKHRLADDSSSPYDFAQSTG